MEEKENRLWLAEAGIRDEARNTPGRKWTVAEEDAVGTRL